MNRNQYGIILLASLAILGAGCKKSIPPAPPVVNNTPPSSSSSNTSSTNKPIVAEFSAEPSSVDRGQSAVLRWTVSDATDISIDNGVGSGLQPSGTRRVIPSDSTTYRLTASGPGGSVTATATVNVNAATPPGPADNTRNSSMSIEQRLSTQVQDAYFDYDKADIRPDARDALTKDADALKSLFGDFADATVTIEGHCDERGSAEYNLALADRRAAAARDFLVQLGVPSGKLRTISYGKERPQCTDATEDCYQKNRRAHFSTGQ